MTTTIKKNSKVKYTRGYHGINGEALPPSRNVIARPQCWRSRSMTQTLFILWAPCTQHSHRAFQISRTRNPNAITRCMLRRSSVILALLYYKKYIVDLELKMTSNFGHAWKDLPFNNIVRLVAYSNKNLAEISRKRRIWWNFGRTWSTCLQDQEPALSKITRANNNGKI